MTRTALLVVAASFVCGLIVGRAFPAHRYTTLGATPYVLDTSTGRVCTPYQLTPPVNLPLCPEK